MKEATVGHLLRGSGDQQEVLLGRREADLFCGGIWNGAGGKMRKSESPRVGLRREIEEEWGVRIDIRTLVHFATLDFYHPHLSGEHSLEWRVHFYQVTTWQGEPRLIEGFSELKWFKRSAMPYEEMNIDNQVWLPMTQNGIASGRLLMGEVFYGDAGMKTIDKVAFRFQ